MQIVFPNVGWSHPISWTLELHKKADPYLSKGNSCLIAWAAIRSFPAFKLQLKNLSFMGLQPAAFRLVHPPLALRVLNLQTWTETTPFILLSLQTDLRIFQLPYHMSLFLVINLSICRHIGFASLKNPDKYRCQMNIRFS